MQAAGDLVVGGVELAAGVQHGEHDLDGGHDSRRWDGLVVDRDAAAVVDHGDGVVDVDGDVDAGGVAGEGLVDGVVDDLVDEVVQPLLAGGADVHGGAQADGLEAFKDRDVFAGVTSLPVSRGSDPRGSGQRALELPSELRSAVYGSTFSNSALHRAENGSR